MFTAQIHLAGDVAAAQPFGAFALPCAAVLTEIQAVAQKAPAGSALSLAVCAGATPVGLPAIIVPGEQHARAKFAQPLLFGEGDVIRAMAITTGAPSAPGGFVTLTFVFKTRL